jgi:hypothetical protein
LFHVGYSSARWLQVNTSSFLTRSVQLISITTFQNFPGAFCLPPEACSMTSCSGLGNPDFAAISSVTLLAHFVGSCSMLWGEVVDLGLQGHRFKPSVYYEVLIYLIVICGLLPDAVSSPDW